MSKLAASMPALGDSSSTLDDNSKLYRRSHSADDGSQTSRQRSRQMSTDDCSSAGGSDLFSGPYEVIEYDAADDGDLGSDFFNDLDFHIEDDTPAADALRANASVRVSLAGKAARAVNMQVVRKLMKRATMKSKSGVVRGKPPRIPPTQSEAEGIAFNPARRRASTDFGLPIVHEEGNTIGKSAPQLSVPHIEDEAHIEDDVVAGTREASKQVLGDVDPHGYLRLLRWKRKGNKQKRTKSYVKGKVINGEHELYTLSIAVMIGVRTSISRTHTEINNRRHGWITGKDFHRTEKYEFRPKGGSNGLTPPHMLSHTFKFKDYSPVVFAYLRRLAGVNEFDFLLSVCGNANFIEFISNAKSGQFFFYSADGRFMIKTMTNAESKFLRRILPQYFRHCVENPNTMMTRFFGMYRVKLYHLRRNVKFVIMNSVYYTEKFLQTFYDLKGSVVGRDAKPGDAVKKDNDLRKGLPNEALALYPNTRHRVKDQLVKDSSFLESVGAMDYSMLVGVHHVPHRGSGSLATSGFQGSRSSVRMPKKSFADDTGESDHEASNASFRDDGSFDFSGDNENGSGPKAITVNTTDSPNKSHHRKLSESIGNFFLENGLEDDDNSYLLGSNKRQSSSVVSNQESEHKKLATIEKLYWPFHRLYDIHGHRRLVPYFCPKCSKGPCACNEARDAKVLNGYNIPAFVAPLSERKDAGFDMDTTGFRMPMTFKGPDGPIPYDGRIFYIGVIDVLQEYTARKALESQYRYMQSQGRPEASCVPPAEYAERFINFFDEITRHDSLNHEMGVEVDIGTKLSTVGEDPGDSDALAAGSLTKDDDSNAAASTPKNHEDEEGQNQSIAQTLTTKIATAVDYFL